jgi:hypothetical protein
MSPMLRRRARVQIDRFSNSATDVFKLMLENAVRRRVRRSCSRRTVLDGFSLERTPTSAPPPPWKEGGQLGYGATNPEPTRT